MDVDQFKNQITNGEIKDAKTYIAGLFFILNEKAWINGILNA